MMGSGTVLAVARSRGHHAYGIDLDPLAVLLSKVWTTTVDPKAVLDRACKILIQAKRTFLVISAGQAYPPTADQETRKFLRYWFDGHSRRQLTSLTQCIARVADKDTRDVLWCTFSRLIISKQSGASRAMDLSHSRPHRFFKRAPARPFDKFLDAVEAVVKNCPQVGQEKVGPIAITRHGDARTLPLADRSIDLVLTSPPYLNAIDYMRCSKFSLVWMGYRISALRQVRGESIGTEASVQNARDDQGIQKIIEKLRLNPKLDSRNYSLLCQYVYDMRQAISEAARVLVTGGHAVYVVGDSTLRGTYVRNSAIVTTVAKLAGFGLESKRTRCLPPNRRYLPPPSAKTSSRSLDGRMRREVVLTFKLAA
jgi:hypothetical protein